MTGIKDKDGFINQGADAKPFKTTDTIPRYSLRKMSMVMGVIRQEMPGIECGYGSDEEEGYSRTVSGKAPADMHRMRYVIIFHPKNSATTPGDKGNL
jgi:hypothetical protein